MSTYRASLARPTTPQGTWDWAETVVAPNPESALLAAYENWVASSPIQSPPPMPECRHEVFPINTNNTSREQDTAGGHEAQG